MTIKVYTILEVAEILQVGRRAVYSYVRDGKLKAVKIGKEWRINEPDLKEFLGYKDTQN